MKIHLTGIGGVGMAGLAVLLKRRGHEVSGCDIHAGARTRWLESLGIPVAVGHDAQHVEGQDLVIVTPAIAKNNPEYAAARARAANGFRCLSRGEVLAKLVSDAPDSIAVCGSHGKTTTATFIAKLLIALGESVEWAIGGETGDFPVAGCAVAPSCACPHAQQGGASVSVPRAPEGRRTTEGRPIASPVLVVEADESDGTLAEYAAKTLVITNCEYDHADHFKTRADYLACYDAARAKARDVVEERARDERLEARAETPDARHETSRLSSQVSRPQTSTLGPRLEPVLAPLAPHNRQNALVAVEVARRRGHSLAAIAAALPGVVAQLPDRRFQQIWPSRLSSRVSRPHPLVYTDYAHHPTEMACAVKMARAAAKGRVIVLFQPHRYSRTAAFRREFAAALSLADEVVICPTYAAFEKPVEGGDSADLYATCRERFNAEARRLGEIKTPKLYLARSCAEAWEHARNTMAKGDLTLLLGAGDIINLVPQIQKDMKEVSDEGQTFIGHKKLRRIWIGAGSNTWKSDLKLDVEYVKTTGPAGRPGAALLADPVIGLRIPWMAGIPGTIGGWVKMNAGAFGHSISEVIESVKVDGQWIPAAACGFSYRHSDIAGEIQDVKFSAQGEDASRETGDESGKQETDEANGYLARRKKFPPGTKGSVFKNPPGDFAGRLLEAAGAKSLRVGGAYVWSEHANVIVAGVDATPSDFLALARLMAARVRLQFGISLEPEVTGLVTSLP